MSSIKRKLIVIHGSGTTYLETINMLTSLLKFKSSWENGVFFINRREGSLIQNMLFNPPETQFTKSIQLIIIARLLNSCITTDDSFDTQQATQIKESRIVHEFSNFGIPVGPKNRLRRAEQMLTEGTKQLAPLLAKLDVLQKKLVNDRGEVLFEDVTRILIENESPDLLLFLDRLRSMPESGGDLDTVGSATFYTYWLKQQAAKENREFLYGRDYIYVFVNYHDSIKYFEKYGPADVLMADMPIAALPEFENDVRYLATKDIHIQRFEDHHPYEIKHIQMFNRLKEEKMVDFFEMGGPENGKEQLEKDMRCGTDIVFDNLIANTQEDVEGARNLKYWAHVNDLALKKTQNGELLTTLIKGGLCKIEIVQTLMECIADDSFETVFEDKKWTDRAAEWNTHFESIQETLRENCYQVSFLGKGADGEPTSKPVNILFALAASRGKNSPKITVNKSVEYLSRSYPEADYLFYCYGASLMVCRRLNQADLTFNLGDLMSELGGPEDGGHSGAAVCKPDSNPKYPKHQLKRVSRSNFSRFCNYMTMRIDELGYKSMKQINCSVAPTAEHMRKGNKKLLMIILITMLGGLLLVALSKNFRRANVLYSNRSFYPNLATPEESKIIAEQELLHKKEGSK
ncbi:MAG: hypothetical protein PF692_09725 [Kiritimatiellae bacterium]|jgi:hypothetical protein|nr:hypothetical protein [Kiritimatiellia bacterium]